MEHFSCWPLSAPTTSHTAVAYAHEYTHTHTHTHCTQANVMLEYDVAEADGLLQKNLDTATRSLEQVVEDLHFLRDQITTMEVSIRPPNPLLCSVVNACVCSCIYQYVVCVEPMFCLVMAVRVDENVVCLSFFCVLP
eukprot:Opistho-2@95974